LHSNLVLHCVNWQSLVIGYSGIDLAITLYFTYIITLLIYDEVIGSACFNINRNITFASRFKAWGTLDLIMLGTLKEYT
jgi:hypothetical protein